jgi:PAS domain S-box-containing protein
VQADAVEPGPGTTARRRARLVFAVAAALAALLLSLISLQVISEMRDERRIEAALSLSHRRQVQILTVFAQIQEVRAAKADYLAHPDAVGQARYDAVQRGLDDGVRKLEALYPGPSDLALQDFRRRLSQEREAIREGRLNGARRSTDPGEPLRDVVVRLSQAEAADFDRLTVASKHRADNAELSVISLVAIFAALLIVAGLIIRRFIGAQASLLDALSATARRHEGLFAGSRDALIVLTPNAKIEKANPAAERMFGWSEAEMIGKDAGLLIDPTGPGDAHLLERLANRRGYLEGELAGEICAVRRDGERFPADISVSPVILPGEAHIIAAVRDVSERRRVEEMKSQFVSTVSHELRTPLTSISGSLGLLAGGAAGALPDKAARLVAIAQANSQRLVRLINDILDIEKLQSGEMVLHLEPIDIRDVARRSIDSVRGMAEPNRIGIELAEGASAMVRGDADRLIQVVVNLLSNAIKFSPADGRVDVRVEPANRIVRLSVRDRGPGVPEAFRSRIFSRFAQADASVTRARGGTGLGLAIAREISERHGGRLWFESAAGEGSVFHLDLPMLDASGEAVAASPRLLIVEHDEEAAERLREMLEADGYPSDIAPSAREAIEALQRRPYGAALVDLQLPGDGDGEGGVGLVRALRGRAQSRDLPVVAIGGGVAHGRASGCTLEVLDWLETPCDPERLREAMRTVLRRCVEGRPLVLQVDDDPDILHTTAAALADTADVASAESLAGARAWLAGRRPDLVILDVGLPDGSGLELLGDLHPPDAPSVPVVVFSARENDATLIEGVEAVLVKSRTSLTTLATVVRRLTGDMAPETPRRPDRPV